MSILTGSSGSRAGKRAESVCHAFGESGVITRHLSSAFPIGARHAGTSLTTVPLLDRIWAGASTIHGWLLRQRPDQLLLLCNPRNPSASYSAADLAQLADMARHRHDCLWRNPCRPCCWIARLATFPLPADDAAAVHRHPDVAEQDISTFRIGRRLHRRQQQAPTPAAATDGRHRPTQTGWRGYHAGRHTGFRDWYRRLLDYLRGNLSNLVGHRHPARSNNACTGPQATYPRGSIADSWQSL